MKTVASPLSVHPPPNHQSVPSSKRRIRKKEKILKFHIKNLWQSFRNTQNVRSKLQQQQRDFTDVFHKEKKKNLISAPAAGSGKLFIPQSSNSSPKVTKTKISTSHTTTESFLRMVCAPTTSRPPPQALRCSKSALREGAALAATVLLRTASRQSVTAAPSARKGHESIRIGNFPSKLSGQINGSFQMCMHTRKKKGRRGK